MTNSNNKDSIVPKAQDNFDNTFDNPDNLESSIFEDLNDDELSFFTDSEERGFTNEGLGITPNAKTHSNTSELSGHHKDAQPQLAQTDINDKISAHLASKASKPDASKSDNAQIANKIQKTRKSSKTNSDSKSLLFIGLTVALLISATVAAAIVILNTTGKIDVMSVFSGDTPIDNTAAELESESETAENDTNEADANIVDDSANVEPLPVDDTQSMTEAQTKPNAVDPQLEPVANSPDNAAQATNLPATPMPTTKKPAAAESQNTEMSVEEFMQEAELTIYRDTSK